MSVVLVVNSGSSSLKYQLIDMDARGDARVAGSSSGSARTSARSAHGPHRDRRTGADDARRRRRASADRRPHGRLRGDARRVRRRTGPSLDEHPPVAVGHRVVHGGARFFEPTVVTDARRDQHRRARRRSRRCTTRRTSPGIRAAQQAFPDVPHVAVFDTAFHQTLAAGGVHLRDRRASSPQQHRIRRYGFHGTSPQVRLRGRRPRSSAARSTSCEQIVLHLGNGASVAAIDGGRSVETSMGLTPLEGLVMGTRSGDIDPAVLVPPRTARPGMSIDELDDAAQQAQRAARASPGAATCATSQAAATPATRPRTLALDVYVHRLRALRRRLPRPARRRRRRSSSPPASARTPPRVRAERARDARASLGIEIDPERNEPRGARHPPSSRPTSRRVAVLVVPTNEELEIARQSAAVAL